MNFNERVEQHREKLRKRGGVAMATEHMPPTGWAYEWYRDVIPQVPECGRNVAHQIARLCGDDIEVTIPYRSLADAVGETDKTGPIAYVQRGIRILEDAGWLLVDTVGAGRGAKTTFTLITGEDTEYKKKWDDGFYDGGTDWHNHHIA